MHVISASHSLVTFDIVCRMIDYTITKIISDDISSTSN